MGSGKWEREQKERRKGIHRHRMSGALLAAGTLASGYRDRQLREQETLPEDRVELAEIKEELSFGVYGQEDWKAFLRHFPETG